MKSIKILALTGFVFLLSGYKLNAQDYRVTQSYANPLRINPAIMGANTDIKCILNYRSQWASIDKGYKTFSFTGMYPVFLNSGKDKVDVSISAMNDKAGAFSTSDLSFATDYSKEIAPNNNLCISIIGGVVQKKLDLNNQTFDQQYVNGSFAAGNPSNELTLTNKVNHPDLGFGFMWFYNPNKTESKLNAYVGFAGYHINQPNQSLVLGEGKLPMRFSYQGGIKFFGNNKIDVSPNVRVSLQKGNLEAASGLYVDYNFNESIKMVVGAWYRTHDAIAVLLGFEHTSFTLGYSYDMVNSGLENAVAGVNAHEITLLIKISRLSKLKSDTTNDEKELAPKKLRGVSPFASF